MKTIRFGGTIFGILLAILVHSQLVKAAGVAQTSPEQVAVSTSFGGRQIYVPGGERLDQPAELQGLMFDQICETMGYASSGDGQTAFVQISAPTEFAVSTKSDDGNLQFQISELDPKNGKDVAVVEYLSCVPRYCKLALPPGGTGVFINGRCESR